VILLGIPVLYLELAMGQRLRKGPVGTWNEVSPYLAGVGITSGFICLFIGFYYNTLIAWVISYLINVKRLFLFLLHLHLYVHSM
jgi:SNF family Na+-dependent transporter